MNNKLPPQEPMIKMPKWMRWRKTKLSDRSMGEVVRKTRRIILGLDGAAWAGYDAGYHKCMETVATELLLHPDDVLTEVAKQEILAPNHFREWAQSDIGSKAIYKAYQQEDE